MKIYKDRIAYSGNGTTFVQINIASSNSRVRGLIEFRPWNGVIRSFNANQAYQIYKTTYHNHKLSRHVAQIHGQSSIVYSNWKGVNEDLEDDIYEDL